MRVENYRGVHRLNRDKDGRVACVACFMCETACPAHCIHIDAGESPWDDREKYPVKFELDELRCIYCGMCSEACPVDAIELTAEYDIVGLSRDEMVFDKEKLLEVYDVTVGGKPRRGSFFGVCRDPLCIAGAFSELLRCRALGTAHSILKF